MESRRNFLKKVIAGSAASIFVPEAFALSGGEFEPLRGMCYGPFRDGQSPGNSYPTEAQMRSDIQLLKNYTGKLRTYGTENNLSLIPRICNEEGMNVYPCAWISTDATANTSQVNGLISVANQNYARTKGFIVGNETLLRGDQTQSALIGYINQLKAKTSLPVSTFEPWHIWNYDSSASLVSVVDYILMGVHPYWESPYWTPNLSIDNAVTHVIDRYNQIKAKYPSKQVVIGETGWPSQGPANYAAVPSIANQKRFLDEFETRARQNGIDYFFFEAFDESWKGEGGVGAYWGLFDKNRNKKLALSEYIKKDFKINKITRSGNNVQLNLNTFDGNPYSIYSSTNLSSWQSVTNFSGTAGTNQTSLTLNNQTSPKKFFRATQNF
ncbi:MAG: glycosyl hydrolase family 17 protein [archaeon]